MNKEDKNWIWIEMGRLCFDISEPLEESYAHLLRGYISNLFPQYDLLHNHSGEKGTHLYRYPKIQYKIVHGLPMMMSIGDEANQILKEISNQVNKIVLGKRSIPVKQHAMEICKHKFGISKEMRQYLLTTPSILLNSDNYEFFRESCMDKQQDILTRAFTAHILRVAKGLEFTVKERIEVQHWLKPEYVILKGNKMLGFKGHFMTNFYLPDFIGIGKSCSRGYGCCLNILLME